MKTSHKIGLFGFPLLVAALGWWLFAATDTVPAPKVEDIRNKSEASPARQATDSAPPARGVLVARIERAWVDADLVAPDDDEDPSETLARSVEQMDVADVISRLQPLPLEDLRGNLGRLLVRRWAELDPVAAGKWAAGLGDVEARHELSAATALAWSERDLEGALAWAGSLPDGDTRSLVLAGLGYEVARERPVEALHLAAGLSADAEPDALTLHALQQWAASDPANAGAWLLQWPESGMRRRALADFATVLATRDGNAAAQFAVTHVAPGAEQDRAVVGIVQRWAQQDFPATVAWVAQFSPGPLRASSSQWLASFAAR